MKLQMKTCPLPFTITKVSIRTVRLLWFRWWKLVNKEEDGEVTLGMRWQKLCLHAHSIDNAVCTVIPETNMKWKGISLLYKFIYISISSIQVEWLKSLLLKWSDWYCSQTNISFSDRLDNDNHCYIFSPSSPCMTHISVINWNWDWSTLT